MRITADSHTDHALTPAHLSWLLVRFGDREAFFLETVELPADLAGLPCGLHGPLVGDEPVIGRPMVRGARKGPSSVCDRAPRLSRLVTVIGGLHNGDCILFTAYGGPAAPREPWDESLSAEDRVASEAFWAEHALSV